MFGAVFAAAFSVALIVIVGPHDFAWSHRFMLGGSGARNVNGEPLALGDHLQSMYYMWLWFHSLVSHPHIPMIDPFQFVLTGHRTYILLGWPLVLLYVPVTAFAGPIAAFNAVVVVSFLATAVCTYLLARALSLSPAAATVAAFAYAFAPWRLVQVGHVGTYLGFLPPLILYLAERALRGESRNVMWGWACAAAYVSLVGSGDLHTTLYTTPVLVTFVIIRGIGVPRERLRRLVVPAAAMVVISAAGLGLIYQYLLGPSSSAPNGISIDAAPGYAPRLSNLLHPRFATERYDYPGIVVALLAVLASIDAVLRPKHRRLIVWLVAVVGVAYVVALAPGFTPTFALIKKLPFAGFVRVPGRILGIGMLGLALLAGFGARIFERRWAGSIVATIAVVLVVAESHLAAAGFSYTSAGDDVLAAVPGNAAVLDLPPFEPGHYAGSRYMLDLVRHPGPRVDGYNVLVPADVWTEQHKTWALTSVPLDRCAWRDLTSQMHFAYVAIHGDLFGPPPFWPLDTRFHYATSAAELENAMDGAPGLHRISLIDDTAVYRIDPSRLRC
jgi:hypothetical protein